MANRCYSNLNDIKTSLGISSSTDDKVMLNALEGATLEIEKYTGRKFNVEYATKYFSGANRLWVNDLLTVSTLKTDTDGNASFETVYTTSDYVLFPLNEYPKTYIEPSDNSDYGSFTSGKKGVEIVGFWGYGDGESATSYTNQSTITASTASGATTINVVSTNLATGQTWLIDSEQFYVKDLTASIASVICGLNGTSKDAHSASSVIYVYDFPADIKQACLNLATALYQNRAKQGLQSESIGDYSYTLAGTSLRKGVINSILDDSILSYRKAKI
jgi:hypothetical protein